MSGQKVYNLTENQSSLTLLIMIGNERQTGVPYLKLSQITHESFDLEIGESLVLQLSQSCHAGMDQLHTLV